MLDEPVLVGRGERLGQAADHAGQGRDEGTQPRKRCAEAGVGATGRSSTAVGNRHLLVPGQRRCHVGEAGAGRAAGHAVDVVRRSDASVGSSSSA